MGRLISEKYAAWQAECEERFQQLKKNEEELNRIFIDIYGLQDELTPDVADKDVTVHRVFDSKDDVPESMKGSNYVRTMRDEIVSLISYRVGKLSCTAERHQNAPDAGDSDLSVWPEPESKAGGRTGAFFQNQYHSGATGYWKDTNDPEYHRQCCSQRKNRGGCLQQQFRNA